MLHAWLHFFECYFLDVLYKLKIKKRQAHTEEKKIRRIIEERKKVTLKEILQR